MPRSRRHRIALVLVRSLAFAVVVIVLVVGVGLLVANTDWGRDQMRALIVRQANLFLTAQIDIARLEGSVLSGPELVGIRLRRDGRTLISIERVSLRYSLRELFDEGTSIRIIRLVRPHVVAARQPDGRWDLASLVKREEPPADRTGPGRRLRFVSIEVVEGTIELNDELRFGAAHVPTRFNALNTRLAFDYQPGDWRLEFADMSWIGGAPDLTVERLAGGIASNSTGLSFHNLSVGTSRSAFTLAGRIARDRQPTELDLQVRAERFAFQEWSGVLTGLRNIAVDASFDVKLTGPLAQLATDLNLRSSGGQIKGPFVLNTAVPGWRGVGSVELERFDLARWMNRPDRPSNISGRVSFDLDLRLGRLPLGTYSFDGAHAAYLGYEGDRIQTRGRIQTDAVQIDELTAVAYSAGVRLNAGSIAVDSPFRFRFRGSATNVDLRRIPAGIPVPHVESLLAFDFDVSGQFTAPFIAGGATFAPSDFLGAWIGAGATGTIDTSTRPVRYTGEGPVSRLNLHDFGAGLDVAWMREPRYAGTVSGRFWVEGEGTSRQTMTLMGGGRLARGDFFDGALTDADVEVQIDGGSLSASYDGRLSRVNPALALADPRFEGSLTGTGRARIAVRDLLHRSPVLADYDIDASLTMAGASARGVQVDRGHIAARLVGGSLTVSTAQLTGPALDARGEGVIEFDGVRPSRFDYDVTRADLAQLNELLGREVRGEIVTRGQMTGPTDALHLAGDATITRLEVSGVKVLASAAGYDVAFPAPGSGESSPRVTVKGRASGIEAFEQSLQYVDGTVSHADTRLAVDLAVVASDSIQGAVQGQASLNFDARTLDLLALSFEVQGSGWQLAPAQTLPRISWDDGGLTLGLITLAGVDNPDQQVAVSGTWREDGGGSLDVRASGVVLDSLTSERPARYGGRLDAAAKVSGTAERPRVSANVTIRDGRVRNLPYQQLAGSVNYVDEAFQVDLRLDQAPDVWLTVAGFVPLSVVDRNRPEQPMDLVVVSSSVSLGLVEGLTTRVRDVTGSVRANLGVIGTSRDPHFTGTLDVSDAGFVVAASGARYKNGRASLGLSSELVRVEAFHLEDNRGRSLELRGSLGTHELRVGNLEIDATAKGFEVLRNEFGTIDVDAQLQMRGQAESPRAEGTLTVVAGALNVDEILDRTLFRPYATEAASTPTESDAVTALNPWNRLGLDVTLRIPGSLRMIGDEVQVTSGTPIGLGDINLRVFGELNLYKDPGDVLYVTGSLDSLTGTYTFQGRRFDIDPTSSINFQGDLNPELYITVQRVISGVETRVTIAGPLREPELQLASTPPLEPSDILSLIVFGAPANLLTDLQQRELAIRAGALAAGFLAAPLMRALERTLGLEIVEIEAPADARSGPRITIGDELLPGLVARFSRQFGPEEYDEATIEYYLSRILRIRATFSDAASLNARSPFRRSERAGIDLILFFSF